MATKHKYSFIGTERERNSNILKEGTGEEIAQFVADVVNESIHFAYNYNDFNKDKVLRAVADKLCLLLHEDGIEFETNKFHETLWKRRKFYTKKTARRYCVTLGMYYPITKEKMDAKFGSFKKHRIPKV